MNRYSTIVADPPWEERGGGKIKRGADRHYPLMKTPAIVELLLDVTFFRVVEDAHLYLWVTNNFLEDGLLVMRSLGFRYISNVVWVKTQYGVGRYFRGQHELCLFGVAGRGFEARTDSNAISSVIIADHPRDARGQRIHSAKPPEFYELVEARSRGPYLELFSRSERPGWDVWGNQAPGSIVT